MAYADIADMRLDGSLVDRAIACAATEQIITPDKWVADRIWRLCASPGWSEAYSYARNSGNAQPGRDAAVITDSMILSAVQAMSA